MKNPTLPTILEVIQEKLVNMVLEKESFQVNVPQGK